VGTTDTCAQPASAASSRARAVAWAAIAGSVPPAMDRTSTCSPATCDTGRHTSHRSPGRAPVRASDARAECVSALALSSTPLGSPVDPEVPMMTAVPGSVAGASERVRASPLSSMTVFTSKASMSCLILAAGSDASTGRMAGPLPSSACLSGSASRAASPTPFSSTACRRRRSGWARARGEVTVDKVRPRTTGGYE
jgi:hypothetical protein